MLEPIRLKRPVASNTKTNPDDILALKAFLRTQGYYKAPDWGLTPYPDNALFTAIEAFQAANDLKVDGEVKPDGETIDAIHSQTRAKAQELQSMGRNGDTLLAHINPAEATLLDRMTDGGSINPKTGLLEFYTEAQLAGAAQANRSAQRAARTARDYISRTQSGGHSDKSGKDRIAANWADAKAAVDRDWGGGNDRNGNDGGAGNQDGGASSQAIADAKAAQDQKQQEQEKKDQHQDLVRRTTALAEEKKTGGFLETNDDEDEKNKNTGVLAENDKPASPSFRTTQAERDAERERLKGKAPNRTFSESQIDASVRVAKAQKAQAASIQKDAKAQKERAARIQKAKTPTTMSPASQEPVLDQFAEDMAKGPDQLWHAATDWHFEDRDALNADVPSSVDEASLPGSGWTEYPASQNLAHDDGIGKKERKFVHPDGREAIYDGDTGQLVTDSSRRGTYNYVNAWNNNKQKESLLDYGEWAARTVGHTVVDIAPWGVAGNTRQWDDNLDGLRTLQKMLDK